jgi:mannose-6-phosphate isomerase-like protein (cupin superfamily)
MVETRKAVSTILPSSNLAVGQGRIKPGQIFRASDSKVILRQHFTPSTANLLYLTCGEFDLPPETESQAWSLPGEETLLFMWKGESEASIDGCRFRMSPYDTLYIPRGASFRLRNPGPQAARIVQCSAPAEHAHPVCHSRFSDVSKQESRIRRLKGKDVYLMLDISEAADKLVAGYTFFQPHQRSWPPHNHTDQEEVYFFVKGDGAMEVYDSPETLSFVHNVHEGDMVTIPFMNYHPVFSQESALEFIWCIAGARYWVGDKNKQFMKGGGVAITT